MARSVVLVVVRHLSRLPRHRVVPPWQGPPLRTERRPEVSETPTGGIGWPDAMDQPISERNVDGCGRTLGDWQDEIRAEVIRRSGATDFDVDGSGEDSGDPLDPTLTEIGQGFAHMEERIAALEEERDALLEVVEAGEARLERLESLLAWERGRGAVVRGWLRKLLALWPNDVDQPSRSDLASTSMIWGARCALLDPSPRVTALLELAEAAEEVRDRYEGPVEGWWGALDRLDAAVDRCREVRGGGPARESEIPEGGPE